MVKSRFKVVFEELKTRNFFSKKSIALVSMILIFAVTGAVFAAGRCVPCKINHYCMEGLRYQCPVDRPVTKTVRTASIDGCLTCVERNGDDYNPIYDDLIGDCVSCFEYDKEKPAWNGFACEACPEDTYWDISLGACKDCTFTVPHTKADGTKTTLCLVDRGDYQLAATCAPRTLEEEDEEFLRKYGIVAQSPYLPDYADYWAGALKYCQDKGLRVPSLDELHSIMNSVYGTNYTCDVSCSVSNKNYVGEQTGCCKYENLTVANQELFNWLKQNKTTVTIWANAQMSTCCGWWRKFAADSSSYEGQGRGNINPDFICVK